MPTFFLKIVVSIFFPYISSPSSFTVPVILTLSTRSFILFKVFKKVDLPHPEGPINAVMAFSFISIFTPFNA